MVVLHKVFRRYFQPDIYADFNHFFQVYYETYVFYCAHILLSSDPVLKSLPWLVSFFSVLPIEPQLYTIKS